MRSAWSASATAASRRARPVSEQAVGGLTRVLRLLPPLAGDALLQLRAQWRGHALTLVGIVWGAASVLLLLGLGSGFTEFLDLSFERTGDRYVQLEPGYTALETGGGQPGRRIEFTLDDVERLRAGVPSATVVAAENLASVSVETPRRTRATVVSAGTAELALVQHHRIDRGRYFDAEDDRLGRRVAVLGAALVEIFFGGEDPLGRSIKIAGTRFDVIGVLERKGMQLVTNMDLHDNMVFLPLRSGRRALGHGREIHTLYLNLWRIDEEPALRAEAHASLWPFHHLAEADEAAVNFQSIPELAEPTRNIMTALRALLGMVGTVALAMAGVGVANLMIAVVNERRLELAVRRACGARRGDVLIELLVETLVIVLAGGAVGIALGLALILVLGWLPLPPAVPMPRFSGSVVVTVFLVLVAVGLCAGLVPARIASRVDPARALRVT